MDEKEREEKFLQIKQAYADHERHKKISGKPLVFDTEHGIFGASDPDVIFHFFKTMHLDQYQSFLDIGCGDGRVVLIASLFTNATGIESDMGLVNESLQIMHNLGLHCKILHGDFSELNMREFDVMFINPDKEFSKGLDQKLYTELKGPIFVYNKIFAPNLLVKHETIWHKQVPIIKYMKGPD